MKTPRKKSPSPPSSAQRELLGEFLVLSAQSGDSHAFGQLVKLWQPPLWQYATRLAGQEAAQDIMQESWMAIGKGLKGLREASLFKRWAFTIVTRSATTRLRQRPREEYRSPERLEEHVQEEQEEGERAEAVGQLRGAIASLKQEDQVLVSLHYLENFELWELARILEIPEGTVKSRLHRIRRQLKDTLERMNHE